MSRYRRTSVSLYWRPLLTHAAGMAQHGSLRLCRVWILQWPTQKLTSINQSHYEHNEYHSRLPFTFWKKILGFWRPKIRTRPRTLHAWSKWLHHRPRWRGLRKVRADFFDNPFSGCKLHPESHLVRRKCPRDRMRVSRKVSNTQQSLWPKSKNHRNGLCLALPCHDALFWKQNCTRVHLRTSHSKIEKPLIFTTTQQFKKGTQIWPKKMSWKLSQWK